MSEREIFERAYEKPGALWTKTEPPQELAKLVESGKIKPCKAIDIGCGEGFYSIYLASKGFDVLGIDFSERAIGYARDNAAKQGADIRFEVMDASTSLEQLKDRFGFVLEWGVMHHIMPPQRQKYVEDVSRLLENGKYLSVCFNEQSPEWGGPGKKYRETPVGTKVYFSSQDELRELFKPHFHIIEARLITLTGREKEDTHTGNYFLMEK